MTDAGEEHSGVVPDDLGGERVDRVLALLGAMSRSESRRLIDAGSVTVDSAAVTASDRIDAGSVVRWVAYEAAERLQPTEVDFGVCHEDEHVIVVDKPPGLTVHPGAATRGPTLVDGLVHRYPELVGVGQQDRWGLVHRLDRDTSGLLIVARTPTAYETLTRALRRRRIGRRYLALTDGTFSTPLGTIDAPIGQDPVHRTRRFVRADGRPAKTHYEVVTEYAELDATLLDVTLETGRTHQIRVHLAAIDHPVIGDRVYGRPHRVSPPRIFLHATRLSFDHPESGEPVELHSPLPADLVACLPDGGSGISR